MKRFNITALLALVGLLSVGNVHAAIVVNCPTISLQAAIDAALPNELISVNGECTENLTITKDDVRINGGVVNGGFRIIGARRVSISNMTIQNSTSDGIVVTEGGYLKISNSMIQDHTKRTIKVLGGHISLRNNNIAIDHEKGGILVNRGGSIHLNGGNVIRNAAVAGVAIQLFEGSLLRQTGVIDIISSGGFRSDPTIIIADMSQADLRNFRIEGSITVDRRSLLSLRKDEIDTRLDAGRVLGSIEIRRGSAVSFGLTDVGSVTVDGTVTCFDTESSADLENQDVGDIVAGGFKDFDCSSYEAGNSQPQAGNN